LYAALASLPQRSEVPVALEQATLRRVRAIATEQREAATATKARWVWWLPIPAAAALALLVAVRLGSPPAADRTAADERVAAALPRDAAAPTPAAAPAGSTAGAARATSTARRPTTPAEVPALVAAEPDLFLELPILENLEKLQHFEDIRTVDMDGNGQGGRG
jgi:hypothetical protein